MRATTGVGCTSLLDGSTNVAPLSPCPAGRESATERSAIGLLLAGSFLSSAAGTATEIGPIDLIALGATAALWGSLTESGIGAATISVGVAGPTAVDTMGCVSTALFLVAACGPVGAGAGAISTNVTSVVPSRAAMGLIFSSSDRLTASLDRIVGPSPAAPLLAGALAATS